MSALIFTSPSSSCSLDSWSNTFSPTKYSNDYEPESLKRAFIELLKLTIPITITALFVSLLLFANLVWIGHHTSKNEFAGAALGNMIVNVMGNSIIIGMTSGLDTQCGQAYGAKLYKMMGVLVQRSIIISHISICIIAIVFWWANDLLILLGQSSANANAAGIFIRIFIASLWPIAMFGNLRRFLQAQRQVIFIPVAVLIALIVQIISLVVLVSILDFGYKGACIALPISYWSMFGSLYFFTFYNKRLRNAVKSTWPGWGKYALRDWSVFLKLSIAGTFQLCAEWWALEIMALFAGHFGAEYVSAFTVTLNAVGVFARLPLGISFSAAVLVGNKLGGSRAYGAKHIYDCAVFMSIVSGFILSLCLIFGKEQLAQLYTHDSDVREHVSEALPYAGVYFFFYAYQRASAGACRGAGRQNIGALIYIVAYYFMGMPIGVWFAFYGFLGHGKPMKLKGLWMGAALSAAIGSVFFLFFRLWINWDKEVKRAMNRIQMEQSKMLAFSYEVHNAFGDVFDEYADEHVSHHSLSNILKYEQTEDNYINIHDHTPHHHHFRRRDVISHDQIEDEFDDNHNPLSVNYKPPAHVLFGNGSGMEFSDDKSLVSALACDENESMDKTIDDNTTHDIIEQREQMLVDDECKPESALV